VKIPPDIFVHPRRPGAGLFVWLFTAAACAQPAPLTNIHSVLNLPDAALAAKPPVELRGVVTSVDVSYDMRFVQDDSGGIFLYQLKPPVDLQPGDWVSVRGVAQRGLFTPMIASAQVTVLGRTNLPPARAISIGALNTGGKVGERVELEGVVQRVRAADGHVFLQLGSGENRCTVSVLHSGDLSDLLDARVQVRGVAAASFDKQQQLTGFQVFVQSLSNLAVVARPAVPAFESPVFPVGELVRQAARRGGQHRVHVRGVVTLHWPGRLTVLQDATGGIVIERGLPGAFQPGDDVEAVGFLAKPLEGVRLHHAEGRRLGTGKEVTVRNGTLAAAAAGSNQLVRMSAEVVAWQPEQEGEISAVLAAGGQHFTARMPSAGVPNIAASFPPGARISVIGVLHSTMREASKVPALSFLLRGPGDVLLLRAAPESPWRWVWVAAGAALLLLVLANVALVFFWRRHQRVTTAADARQKNAEARFLEMERQLRSAHRERELIAQELHDNIIQSIYSVGLGLDEARRLAEKNPDRVPERLTLAVGSLNTVIRDVRAFLGGLEPRGLDGHELKAALKSVLLATGDDQQARFSIRIDPAAASALTTAQATEVFNIAKEAMTNAMRHANAALTTVTLLSISRGGVRLEIEDNGVGFDPAGLERDSLGLRHMQQRAQAMGAIWRLDSEPGRGTRIIVEISATPLLTSSPPHDNE